MKSENIHPHDKQFMERCIQLARESWDKGDAPFGSLIAREGKLVAEGLNDAHSRVSEHAEIIALNRAHHINGSSDLSAYTLYTSCEPCPMCSFMIREYKISRVVFALHSHYMGGFSKWKILQDQELERFPPFFKGVPAVVGGFMESEAIKVMNETPFWMFGPQKNR